MKGDGLLWLAAAAVCAGGGAWLVVTKPWSAAGPGGAGAPRELTTAAAQANASAARAVTAPEPADALAAGVEDPLRMADLALAAGMLVEPEEYSAWTLYERIATSDPSNAGARAGLEKVAAELVRRGTTALEQGRVDDARATAQRILKALPGHAGAAKIAAEIAAAEEARAAVERELAIERENAERAAAARAANAAADAQARETSAPPVRVDPVAAAHAAFLAAMTDNRLLAPADDNAKQRLAALVELAPDHELTRSARARLARELLSRGRESLEALDVEAAQVWVAEAERAGAAGAELAAVRAKLDEQLIAAEAAKPISYSELEIVHYEAPYYPSAAASRKLEGWVEIEFTVSLEGRPREITVVDASHASYFRDEAVMAVQAWRFKPRVFMGEPIAQRARARIRFVP